MENNLENDCDIILKFCLGLKHGTAFCYRGTEECKLLPQTRLYVAIKELKQKTFFLPRNNDEYLDLTIEGRKFAESGGYAGKRLRDNEISKSDEEEKQLSIRVNNSILDTNKSVIDTNKSIVETNESVINVNKSILETKELVTNVNKSVIDTNNSTRINYRFQGIFIILTFIIATISLYFSYTTYRDSYESKNPMQERKKDSLKIQQLKDSLVLLKKKQDDLISQDSLLKKHL